MTFTFPGVAGMYLMILPLGSDGSYTTSSGQFSDLASTVDRRDDGTWQTINATIYVTPLMTETVFTLNPVYQASGSGVYVLPGSPDQSILINRPALKPVSSTSLTFNLTNTQTVAGQTTTDSMTVSIKIQATPAPRAVTIVQMDADDAMVTRTSYTPGQVPADFTTLGQTAYLIVETTTDGGAARQVYGPDDDTLTTVECGSDNICQSSLTTITWPS